MPEKKSISENETFVLLIQAAREDDAFRVSLLALLNQTPFQRKSILNGMAERMAAGGLDAKLVEAFAALADEDIAKKALEMLQE